MSLEREKEEKTKGDARWQGKKHKMKRITRVTWLWYRKFWWWVFIIGF
jgi:hypothetical protein